MLPHKYGTALAGCLRHSGARAARHSRCFGVIAKTMDVDEIPVIDIAPFFEGHHAGKVAVGKQIDEACANAGFFMVRNHGVSEEARRSVMDAGQDFFQQPLTIKRDEVGMSEDYPYGWEASEVLISSLKVNGQEVDAKPDLKETMNMCLGPENDVHPNMFPIRWPTQPATFETDVTRYYRECELLCKHILRAMALGLDLPEDWFEQKKRLNGHISVCRMLYYPAQEQPPAPGQVRASAHSDYGTITIVKPDAPGLQVLAKDDKWIYADVPDDCYSINVGDLFARWTNDKYRSTLHRVINPEGEEDQATQVVRHSVAFFHNLNPDALVETIPTCITDQNPKKYHDVEAGEYLMAKHFNAMGYPGYEDPDKLWRS